MAGGEVAVAVVHSQEEEGEGEGEGEGRSHHMRDGGQVEGGQWQGWRTSR